MRVPMSAAELRAEQLDVLDAFATFCNEHDLRWMLYAGSLLGAVRHSGFIPWDDDLDVMMPREHFVQFCEEFTWPDLEVLRPGSPPHFPHAYAKVCKKGTLVVEDDDDRNAVGVNIDVFPYDRNDAGPLVWNLQKRLSMGIRAIVNASLLPARRGRSITRRAALRVLEVVLVVVPVSVWVSMRTGVARLFGDPAGRHVAFLVASVPWRVPAQWIEPSEPLAFEGRALPVPRRAEALLEEIYGDFMSLPPERARVSPHNAVAYFLDR